MLIPRRTVSDEKGEVRELGISTLTFSCFSMKKIRINVLARELEVKSHEILDLLPELGVSEKKTHSSSVDEDVAISSGGI